MDTVILLGILRGSHTISTVSQCLRHFAPLPWCVLTSTTKSFSTELLANSNQPFYWRWSNYSVLSSFKFMCVSVYRCMCVNTCDMCVCTDAYKPVPALLHMLKLEQRKT